MAECIDDDGDFRKTWEDQFRSLLHQIAAGTDQSLHRSTVQMTRLDAFRIIDGRHDTSFLHVVAGVKQFPVPISEMALEESFGAHIVRSQDSQTPYLWMATNDSVPQGIHDANDG